MDMITLAMAKAYMDKHAVKQEEKTILPQRTVTLQEVPWTDDFSMGATIELDSYITNGWYNVYLNGTKYEMCISRSGDDRYDDGKMYMYLGNEYLQIIFYENPPATVTVSVTQNYIPEHLMPANFYRPDYIDLKVYDIENAIIELFSQGGGTARLTNVYGFWGEFNQDRNPIFMIQYETAVLLISGITLFLDYDGGGVLGAAFSFFARVGTHVYFVAVSITRDGDGAIIDVKVT